MEYNYIVPLIALIAVSLANQGFALPLQDRTPNFVVLFADDLGYGDLSFNGHPTIRTPNLDRMAAEGMRFTQWYSAFPSCSPSRAALLTGRLPKRNGINCVLPCCNVGGISETEILIPSLLKKKNYATAAVGKWHLGQQTKFLPTNYGFDTYFGIPYSADMGALPNYPCGNGDIWCCAPLPLFHNETIIQQPVDILNIEPNMGAFAIDFIKKNQNNPFFLYVAFMHTHVSVAGEYEQWSSAPFTNTSLRGRYGDALEETDWVVGQILETLRQLNLDSNTLVFFTSDNGPWLIKEEYGGSSGLFRSGKDTTWEGGIHMPGIAWWPNTIIPFQVSEAVVSTMDIYATLASLAGVPLPTDRVIDGLDISNVLLNNGPSPHDFLFFYHYDGVLNGTNNPVFALRYDTWKVHYITSDPAFVNLTFHNPPLLFNIQEDPSEQYPLDVKQYSTVMNSVQKGLDVHLAGMVPAFDQCSLGTNFTLSPCCSASTNCVCGQDLFTSPSSPYSFLNTFSLSLRRRD